MSVLAWDHTELGYAGSTPKRPHLVLVQGGARTTADAGGVRLTRRGRLALFLLVLAVVAVTSLSGLRGAGASEPLRAVTVAPGETLSQIAVAELPTLSMDQAIVAIQIANNLSTAQVSAGQQLVIPSS